MSSAKKLIALAVAGAVLLTAVLYAQESREPSFDFLNNSEFEACGLHKLTAQEQSLLFSRLGVASLPSYCETSAEAFVKRDGYHRIRVLGAAEDPESHNRYLLYVWFDYRVRVLESPLGGDPLEPGIYWSDHDDPSRTWGILYPDGKEQTLWERN